jgi:hypothetical protein
MNSHINDHINADISASISTIMNTIMNLSADMQFCIDFAAVVDKASVTLNAQTNNSYRFPLLVYIDDELLPTLSGLNLLNNALYCRRMLRFRVNCNK